MARCVSRTQTASGRTAARVANGGLTIDWPVLQVAVSNADNPGQVSEVAACLGGSAVDASAAALPNVAGTLYCCMPLPFTGTGLPLHVHGTWALQSNRRELWTNIDDERKLVRCVCLSSSASEVAAAPAQAPAVCQRNVVTADGAMVLNTL